MAGKAFQDTLTLGTWASSQNAELVPMSAPSGLRELGGCQSVVYPWRQGVHSGLPELSPYQLPIYKIVIQASTRVTGTV